VVGPDPGDEAFFWLAGQGGYGVQTAPALARYAAAAITGADAPTDVLDLGLRPDRIAPDRFRGPRAS
jgi:D-arginine dehydrogenase